MISESKDRTLVRHSLIGKHSSPAVRAQAPINYQTMVKSWKINNYSSFPTPKQPIIPELYTSLTISKTHGPKYISGTIL